MTNLQSRFKPNENVLFVITQPNGAETTLTAKTSGVHFTESKVTYDLELPLSDNTSTYLYGVDSFFIKSIN